MHTKLLRLGLGGLGLLATVSCGASQLHTKTENARTGAATSGGLDATGQPRLALSTTDQVLSTLVIPYGGGANGLGLTSAVATTTSSGTSWIVDMQDSLPVVGGVAPDKYLKVTGSLSVPTAATNQDYNIGCIYIDLKDNVYYREKTWLRLATTGIDGTTFSEVMLPLSVDLGSWQPVPLLENSVTVQTFASETIKSFTGTMCFKLDFTNAPADHYAGQIVVQYLRPGTTTNPPACTAASTAAACAPVSTPPSAPAPSAPPASTAFACSQTPSILTAGQTTTLNWTGVPTGDPLEFFLSTSTPAYTGSLGTITASGGNGGVYTAPATIPADAVIVVTARPSNSELLPAYCQVTLTADGQIGVPDDGTSQGLPGNVYQLPSTTTSLPNFSTLTPILSLIVGNLDVPNREFTEGFPGVPNLTEWFGIRFRGQILIPSDETCSFEVAADDGANLYIDGNQIVNDDGLHAVTDKFGSATLSQGAHAFEMDYFQGPRYYIALQLFWKCGTATDYSIVPASAFLRPLQ